MRLQRSRRSPLRAYPTRCRTTRCRRPERIRRAPTVTRSSCADLPRVHRRTAAHVRRRETLLTRAHVQSRGGAFTENCGEAVRAGLPAIYFTLRTLAYDTRRDAAVRCGGSRAPVMSLARGQARHCARGRRVDAPFVRTSRRRRSPPDEVTRVEAGETEYAASSTHPLLLALERLRCGHPGPECSFAITRRHLWTARGDFQPADAIPWHSPTWNRVLTTTRHPAGRSFTP